MNNFKVKLLIVRTIKLKQCILFIHAQPLMRLSSRRVRPGTLLLVSFNGRCRPTRMPKMAVNCAVVHHCKGALCLKSSKGT